MLRSPLDPKPRGELAELAFLYRASSLGILLSKPYGDSAPYDFLLDNGRRIFRVQVKSVSACHQNAYKVAAARGRRSKRPYTPGEIHFLAVLVLPHDAWYIIPVSALRSVQTLQLAPHFASRRRFERFRERWDLLTR